MATALRQNRTEATIKAELDAALTQYRAGAHTLPAPQIAELSAVVRDLQMELGAYYAAGAQVCPQCGNLPFGMQRNPNVVEVGCLACIPQAVKRGAETMRRSPAAQGKTPQEAVANWNAGKWVELPIQ